MQNPRRADNPTSILGNQRIPWMLFCGALTLAFELSPWAMQNAWAQAVVNAPNRSSKNSEPKPLTKYMGRRIALPMSYHGIPWLNRPERVVEEKPQEMLEQLQLQLGMTVCDMGCGDGFYSIELAKRVGAEGKVLAVDIQPEMLQSLSRRSEQSGLKNIDMILGNTYDPKLPNGEVDLILMVDVYHEFSNPVEMLAAMRASLKPKGLIALVEFRGEDPTVPIKPEHKMTKKQILKEYKANGFKVTREYDRLPWQHLIFLEPDEKAVPAASTSETGDESDTPGRD